MINKRQVIVIALMGLTVAFIQCAKSFNEKETTEAQATDAGKDKGLIAEGKDIFRFDTYNDETFWSGLLHLDKAILGEVNGGYGPGVSPLTALTVGLKVDSEALPPEVVADIISGDLSLTDPM